MKIKHFAGYGSVNAKKISSSPTCLKVRVWGNHEYGLERKDNYDVFNWLVKRFDKKHTDYIDIVDVKTEVDYERNDKLNIDEEVCVYTILFRTTDYPF